MVPKITKCTNNFFEYTWSCKPKDRQTAFTGGYNQCQ